MTTHELKSWPEWFEPIWRREKNFELRKNDRDYQVGDKLVLREWDPKTEIYTGRECHRYVQYVLHGAGNVGTIGPLKGLDMNYVILGLENPLLREKLEKAQEDARTEQWLADG